MDRILSYYQKQNYDQHLILADGSEKQWPGAEKFKGKYLHLPSVSFRERLIAGLEQSESDLAVLCADDDFLVPAGFEACVEFLRNNPDYACAQGQYGRFVINEDEIRDFHVFLQLVKRYCRQRKGWQEYLITLFAI